VEAHAGIWSASRCWRWSPSPARWPVARGKFRSCRYTGAGERCASNATLAESAITRACSSPGPNATIRAANGVSSLKFSRSTRSPLLGVLLSASLSAVLFCSTPARAQDPPPPPPDSDPATQGPPPDAPPPPPPDSQAPPTDKAAPKTDSPSQTPTVSVTPATPAPQATSFEISGSVKSGKTPLPGVTVTAANTLTGKKYSIATGLDGSYKFSGLPRGRYVVRVEFMAFAPQTQEIVLKPDTPTGKFDAEMILASRQAEQSPTSAAIAAITGGRGFQSLSLENSLSALEGGASGGATGGGGTGGASAGDIASLPMGGAGTDVSNESVSISGAQGRSQDFGAGSEDDLQSRIEEFRQRAQAAGLIPGGPTQGGAGGGGGFGGPGGFGGGGPIAIGRLGRGFNVNQPHGFLYFSDDDANFDAKPYSLTGIETPKASYNFARFGANAGGPLTIPHIFNGGGKWFFFAGWNGSRGSQPYDAYSTVPTAAERAGNFSGATYNDGTPVAIFNPTTGEQFSFNGQANVINPALLSAQAKALLQYIPLPNLDTVTNNFHYVTDQDSDTDAISLRLIHNFGDSTNGPFGGGGRGGGGRNGRHAQNNINFGLNYSRNNSATVNPYPSLAGNTNTQGVQATGGWTYGNGRRTNILRFTYNHNHVSTSNLYSNNIDVAGLAGIGGVSTDPFDFGLPGISFTTRLRGVSLIRRTPFPTRSLGIAGSTTGASAVTIAAFCKVSVRRKTRKVRSSSPAWRRPRSRRGLQSLSAILATTSPIFCLACRNRRRCNPARILTTLRRTRSIFSRRTIGAFCLSFLSISDFVTNTTARSPKGTIASRILMSLMDSLALPSCCPANLGFRRR
jgi:Carboxypeptidase regulatory-like domain